MTTKAYIKYKLNDKFHFQLKKTCFNNKKTKKKNSLKKMKRILKNISARMQILSFSHINGIVYDP